MRRADRLFDIIEYLRRHRRVVTAAELAEKMEVSIRTIYRDIADLQASRVLLSEDQRHDKLLSYYSHKALMPDYLRQ